MLSPKRQIVLLPQDRQIMDITGMSEEQYRWFVRQAIFETKLRPGEPVALGPLAVIGINLVVGLLLTAASALLAPKPRIAPAANKNENFRQNTVQGQNLVTGTQFTPKAGFDSVQNVVELGSVIPIVYAKRQQIDGVTYGGIRVNTNLLWSQLYSIGGGQLLRAIFLIGEGAIESIDPTQFAIGNNLIGSYDLGINLPAGRVAVYTSLDTGRITEDDYIAGVSPSEDLGNAQNAGAPDVFYIRNRNDQYEPDFCYASVPSNQSTFGLYGFIGNRLCYRPNPVFRPALTPTSEADTKTIGSGDDAQTVSISILACNKDRQVLAERRQQNCMFSGQTGLLDGNGNISDLNEGDEVQLAIYQTTDGAGSFTDPQSGGTDQGEVNNKSIAQAIAGRQRGYDELVDIGDRYRIGSAIGICIDRTEDAFTSDADNTIYSEGTSVFATFRITEAGSVHRYSSAQLQESPQDASRGFAYPNSATETSHIMKIAEAVFATDREGYVVEIGLKSALQVSINGLCDFSGAKRYNNSTIDGAINSNNEIDWEACEKNVGDEINGDMVLNNFNSGTYSTPETRYSFFRLSYRVAGSSDEYIQLSDNLFGVRSATGVAVYNYLRLEFPTENRWQIKITPVSGWEVRNPTYAPGKLRVLDPHFNNRTSILTEGVRIRFTGETVQRNASVFGINSFRPGREMGQGYDDDQYQVDKYARLAEAFMYSEVTASTSNPEHQVVYVNTISPNKEEPSYDSMALVGLNIRSSKEISSLSQFSVYVNGGRTVSVQQFEDESTSDFPLILYDLLTNERYGTGSIVSPLQVDKASFDAAAVYTRARKYFFDGAISERINLRSWGAETAGHFLLDFMMRNGKFVLKPTVNFDGPEQITGMFNAGNILDDTFELSYNDDQDRIPPRITVVWRQEREDDALNGKGLFPRIREVTVREADTPEDAPIEKIDISDFCTSEIQAVDRAKWECRLRRLVTHTVAFKTTPTQAALDLGAVFKLGIETVSYNQPQNGAISASGEVRAWPPIADGDYPVLLWDGTGTTIQRVTLSIVNGKALDVVNAVFAVESVITNTQTYKTQSLSYDEDGNIDVEAIYWPTDASDNSMLVKDWDVNWVIEGLL